MRILLYPGFFSTTNSSSSFTGCRVDTRTYIPPENDETPIVMVQACALNTPESLPIGVGEPEHKKTYGWTIAF